VSKITELFRIFVKINLRLIKKRSTLEIKSEYLVRKLKKKKVNNYPT
jgi:hypothetical protein